MAFKLDGLSLLLILLVLGAVLYICLGCKITCGSEESKSSYSDLGAEPKEGCYKVSSSQSKCKPGYHLQKNKVPPFGAGGYSCCRYCSYIDCYKVPSSKSKCKPGYKIVGQTGPPFGPGGWDCCLEKCD